MKETEQWTLELSILTQYKWQNLSKTSFGQSIKIHIQVVNNRYRQPLLLQTQSSFTVNICCKVGFPHHISFEEIQLSGSFSCLN